MWGIRIIALTWLAGVSQSRAWDQDWVTITLARNGSWGVARDSAQSQAIAAAIRACKAMAGPASDCGAQHKTMKGEWAVAELCGDHKIIASGSSLAEAEREALNRAISLQLLYAPDLPSCKRVVTVDPTGTINTANDEYAAARPIYP